MTRNNILPISIYQISEFLPDIDAIDDYINQGHAGLRLPGFISMQMISKYKSGIEQIAEVDFNGWCQYQRSVKRTKYKPIRE